VKAEREKIIELAMECDGGFTADEEDIIGSSLVGLDAITAFYHAAQKEAFEQAAKVCEKKWRKEDSFDSHANAKEIRQLITE